MHTYVHAAAQKFQFQIKGWNPQARDADEVGATLGDSLEIACSRVVIFVNYR